MPGNFCFFQLKDFQVIYHSGATEAINSFLQGLERNDGLIYSAVDHPCVYETVSLLADRGVGLYAIPVDSDGNLL